MWQSRSPWGSGETQLPPAASAAGASGTHLVPLEDSQVGLSLCLLESPNRVHEVGLLFFRRRSPARAPAAYLSYKQTVRGTVDVERYHTEVTRVRSLQIAQHPPSSLTRGRISRSQAGDSENSRSCLPSMQSHAFTLPVMSLSKYVGSVDILSLSYEILSSGVDPRHCALCQNSTRTTLCSFSLVSEAFQDDFFPAARDIIFACEVIAPR